MFNNYSTALSYFTFRVTSLGKRKTQDARSKRLQTLIKKINGGNLRLILLIWINKGNLQSADIKIQCHKTAQMPTLLEGVVKDSFVVSGVRNKATNKEDRGGSKPISLESFILGQNLQQIASILHRSPRNSHYIPHM